MSRAFTSPSASPRCQLRSPRCFGTSASHSAPYDVWQPVSTPLPSTTEFSRQMQSSCSLGAKVRLQVGKLYGIIWRKVTPPSVVYRTLKSGLDHIPEQRSQDVEVKYSGTQIFRGHGIPAWSLMGVIPSVQAFKNYLKYILIMFPSLHSSQMLFTSTRIQLYAFSLKTNQQEIF